MKTHPSWVHLYLIPKLAQTAFSIRELMVIKDQNVLQKHVNFFYRDKDGVVYPWETFQGFREIGCGVLLSSLASVFIDVGLRSKTRLGKFPSLLFPIVVKNIQKAKHGRDSGVYDTEGRFVLAKFEEIFGKHARTNANALTSDELMTMLKSNRVPKDYAGWIASYSEWKILYMLKWASDG
ncbi:probable peroxygenase 4 [Rhododendron vialii]|uniref:probable peroxygenase 4 n=1 Tax=Rhododendron vialii TaxID=182163 RepID=UPI00265E65CC|nr:probable peroxygenase 4 [Rhododendron vialii]